MPMSPIIDVYHSIESHPEIKVPVVASQDEEMAVASTQYWAFDTMQHFGIVEKSC